MATRPKVLWVSDEPAPARLRDALADRWELAAYDPYRALERQLNDARLAVIYPNGQSNDPRKLGTLLSTLDHTSAVAILLLSDKAQAGWATVKGRSGQFLCLPSSSSPETVAAQLAAAAALQPAIANLQSELAAARDIANGNGMDAMDEEMRLAARLQRDFLPRRLPEVGPVRFGVLYRPAAWLSGDIYDVTRLDESHLGFYVADAVGHGMPAALLTMFIKHALATKRIVGNTYQIIPPEVSLAELNADICQQNLSSCQFCTAFYGVLDTKALALTYCRAGHPPPVLFRTGQPVATLVGPGSLLGVFEEEKFESRTVQLQTHDRLVVFSDGAEEALRHSLGKAQEEMADLISPLADLSRDEFLLQLAAWMDDSRNSPNGDDDITVVVVDVEDEQPASQ